MDKNSNVKFLKKHEGFGENLRYFTMPQYQKFLENIDNYKHKLMMLLIYQTGCRVSEFVRIQLKHIDFEENSIYFPAENTKTKQRRTSFVSKGLINDIKSWLKQSKRISVRSEKICNSEEYLFSIRHKRKTKYTENRIRQIFQKYVNKAGLDRVYGEDSKGRKLRIFTIHSLRHSHCMHSIHIHKLPIPIVQRQVGHKTLQATMAYCKPSDEMVKKAYEEVVNKIGSPR